MNDSVWGFGDLFDLFVTAKIREYHCREDLDVVISSGQGLLNEEQVARLKVQTETSADRAKALLVAIAELLGGEGEGASGIADVADSLVSVLLLQFHAEQRIGEIQGDLTAAELSSEDLERIGRITLEIRALNRRRVVMKNDLNKRFGSGLQDAKVFYPKGG